MLAGILIATSATIALFLGLAHIYLTFFTRAFAVRDAALAEKLKSVSPRISGQTTMWRAGVGFHASHALGVIFFGLVYGYLALAERDFLIRSPFLVVLGALVLLGYVILAKLYWFDRPLVGVALALACYVAGVFCSEKSPIVPELFCSVTLIVKQSGFPRTRRRDDFVHS